MNRQSFNRLPKIVQKVILGKTRSASWEMTQIEVESDFKTEQMLVNKGNTVIHLTPDEMELWRVASEPIHKQWVKEMEDKGLPGQKVLDTTKRLIKEYSRK
jgi:TRAP-type C4-dicarboxylate transport system substrate-binding protein